MVRFFHHLLVGFLATGLLVACAKQTPEHKLQQAQEALMKRDPLGAIVLAHEVLRENTTGSIALQARQLLFNCHYAGRDIKACRLVLNDIITQMGLGDPSGQAAAQWKIQTYVAVRQTTEALAQTRSFLQAVTTGTAFWAGLMVKQGDLLRATNQLTTAQQVYAQVFLQPDLAEQQRFDSLDRLAGSYATTQSAAAGIQFFEKYLSDAPSTDTIPHVYMVMGHLKTVSKQPDEAKSLYHKGYDAFEQAYQAASGADEKTIILMQYARAHEFAGDIEEAAALLRKGLQDFPTSSRRINLYYNLAALYANNKKYDEAIAICREIPSQFPNDPRRVNSYFMAADCHREQKKFDVAMGDYREIIALFPGQRFAQDAMMKMRETEEMRRREAETSATLAAALLTSGTLATTSTGAAVTSPSAAVKRPAPALLLPPLSTAPVTRPAISATTASAAPKPPAP